MDFYPFVPFHGYFSALFPLLQNLSLVFEVRHLDCKIGIISFEIKYLHGKIYDL
jgi:hypothetical protein